MWAAMIELLIESVFSQYNIRDMRHSSVNNSKEIYIMISKDFIKVVLRPKFVLFWMIFFLQTEQVLKLNTA